jgi:8-oxo-dGTP pyrophosphatase MutT (NUDIX family)
MTDATPPVRLEPAAALAAHHPATDTEAADLDRMRHLVAAATAHGLDPWARSAALHLTGSALIVHPPTRRVLLRWHARQGSWLHVGGHADPGETEPLAIALREAIEETGLDDVAPWPDPRLLQVAIVPVPASATEPDHEHADLRFVLATATPDAARPEKPTAPLRWTTTGEAAGLTTSDSLRQMLQRLSALLH